MWQMEMISNMSWKIQQFLEMEENPLQAMQEVSGQMADAGLIPLGALPMEDVMDFSAALEENLVQLVGNYKILSHPEKCENLDELISEMLI
jgi:hypothetical protein